MNYQEQRTYVGNLRQLFGLRESRLAGGKADGVRIVDIHNGGDLALCVAADRCMDIPEVRYRGRVLNYITPNGIVHPSYYSCYGEGWSEAFAGGLLYTCGLSNTGLRESLDWESQKEHGCIANTPAEQFSAEIEETADGPAAVLRGVMREGMLAGVDLRLTRTIRVEYLRNVIEVTDTVRNDGYRTAPHMLLYHCNLGYPLLQPDSRLRIPNQGVRPRTPFAKTMLPELDTILPPQDAMEEMCYYNFPPYDLINNHNVLDYAYFVEELQDVLPQFLEIAPKIQEKLHVVHQGESIAVDECRFDFLFSYHEGLTNNLMNDSSLVFKLFAPNKTVLFLGDLGPEAGDILFRESKHLLKSDLVQMAHHGHMNVGMEVYAEILPEGCLWCAPDWLYEEEEFPDYLRDTEGLRRVGRNRLYGTKLTRKWMDLLGVKKHYVTKDGTQRIVL